MLSLENLSIYYEEDEVCVYKYCFCVGVGKGERYVS